MASGQKETPREGGRSAALVRRRLPESQERGVRRGQRGWGSTRRVMRPS
ncbi:hypothetical protein SERN_1943 [Serinibacter arcticus]|uniref:Uncharacterized protein n=1 Tax=Serinibacter arcticus TaxID=1655435 RepID=A0A4Z1DZC1_9MICO|nr:hypothetical protein SERN_1943 [Serinibacter arcticus]